MKYDIVRSFLEKLLIFLPLSSFLGQYSLFFAGLAHKSSLLGNQRYISEVGTIDVNENPQTTSNSRKNGFFQKKLKKIRRAPPYASVTNVTLNLMTDPPSFLS